MHNQCTHSHNTAHTPCQLVPLWLWPADVLHHAPWSRADTCLGLPAVFATHQDSAANAQESLLLSAILVILTRALVWTFMHILHRRFEKAKHEQQKNARQLRSIDSTASLAGMAEKPLAGRHAELQPLMRGAWIVGPPAMIARGQCGCVERQWGGPSALPRLSSTALPGRHHCCSVKPAASGLLRLLCCALLTNKRAELHCGASADWTHYVSAPGASVKTLSCWNLVTHDS